MPSAVLTLSRWTRSGSCSWHGRPRPNVTNTFLYLGTTEPEGGGVVELEKGGMTRTHNIWILLGAAGKKIRKGSFLSVSRAFLGESWTRCGCLTADPAGNRWRRQPSDTTERETEKTFGCEIRHADLKFLYIVLIAKWFVTVFYTILRSCVPCV